MLTFKCEHCSESKEYTKATINQISRDTVDIKGHVVCKECGEEYKAINQKVQEYAEAKRQELEDEFFGTQQTQESSEKTESDDAGDDLNEISNDLLQEDK